MVFTSGGYWSRGYERKGSYFHGLHVAGDTKQGDEVAAAFVGSANAQLWHAWVGQISAARLPNAVRAVSGVPVVNNEASENELCEGL